MRSRKLLLLALLGLAAAPVLSAQERPESQVERQIRLARRAAGVRVGVWQVSGAEGDTTFKRSPRLEVYFQRGLDEHIAIESSAGVWWGSTTEVQGLTNEVETRTYVLPLMTALKLYPLTTRRSRIEPYVLGGIGFALGIADEGANAIGGGGTSIATGFGFKGGTGIEYHVGTVFGIAAGARYEWVRYGEQLLGISTFKGVGFEGAITYRFPF